MNKFDNTTAEEAIRKIVARIADEFETLEESATPARREGISVPLGESDFSDICAAACAVKEWADRLENFAAVCEFGEADDDDVEKYVPIA